MESIKKNYIFSVLYQILIIIVPLLTAPYLTRVIGATKLGVYSYTNSIAYYFYLFAMLGMANYGNREVAKVRDNKDKLNKIFSELVTMQISFGLLVSLVYGLYIFFSFIQCNANWYPSLLWGFYVVSAMFDISWFFWGIEKFSLTVLRNTIIKVFTTLFIFIFIKTKSDLNLYIFLISISYLVSSIVLWKQVHKYVSIKFVKLKDAYVHFKKNFILFIPVIAVSVYTVMDKIMLGHMSQMKSLGIYDSIQKIMTLPTGIITALGSVMLPRMSNLIANGDKENVYKFLEISIQFSSMLSIAISFGLASIAPTFTIVYFGKEFIGTSLIMQIFTITIPFIAWANVIRTQYLIPSGRDNIYIISVFLGAIFNLIINIILIPRFSELGAVIGTVIAEFVVAFVQTFFIRNEIELRYYLKNSCIFLLPGIIMFGFVYFIQNLIGDSLVSLIAQILIGIFVYLFISLSLLLKSKTLFSKELLIYSKKMLRKVMKI